MEFNLKIKLGNAAMQTPQDVAKVLREVAVMVEMGRAEMGIKDLNGNTVGGYTATFPEVEEV